MLRGVCGRVSVRKKSGLERVCHRLGVDTGMRGETRKGTMKIAGVERMRGEEHCHCRNLQNIGSVSKELLPFHMVMISIS
jgi:hypothetical protein